MKKVNVYTDGACKGNPGAGGWAAILEFEGREKELCGGDNPTTNNRMELIAAIEGLKALKSPCIVTLYSDSQYLVNAINKGWLDSWKAKGWRKADKSPVLNDDLWKILDSLLAIHQVEFIWVKGHDGHAYNERCDALASGKAEELNQ
jgi:ribonuclease HI